MLAAAIRYATGRTLAAAGVTWSFLAKRRWDWARACRSAVKTVYISLTLLHTFNCRKATDGYTAHFVKASDMLRDLAEQPDARSRHRRVKHYAAADLLGVDECWVSVV